MGLQKNYHMQISVLSHFFSSRCSVVASRPNGERSPSYCFTNCPRASAIATIDKCTASVVLAPLESLLIQLLASTIDTRLWIELTDTDKATI
jgi:hypothetical protein